MEAQPATPHTRPDQHPRRTHVYFIVDESGSMSSYTQGVRQSIGNIIDDNSDPLTRYTVITFSNTVDYATDMAKLRPPEHQNTSIAPAFRKMVELINATPAKRAPERVMIAFISDGIDTDQARGAANIRNLPRLPVESILFTVAVGDDFPTSLVVDTLRPKYHSGSPALPLVLPVSAPTDLPWAFGQLESLLVTELQQCAAVPDAVTAATSTRDLILYVRARYNECIVRCAQSGRTARENYTLLSDTHQAIHAVGKIAKERLRGERSEPGGQRVKPLLSNLVNTVVYSTRSCITLCAVVVTKLNEMMASASKGQLISELSDCAKKELIGYTYTEGKLMHVATKYRAANFATTKRSLLRLLKDYAPKPSDKGLSDPINLSDQAEYFANARDNLLDLIPFTHTLPGILHMLPFVCRTLTLREPVPIDALQMNEWLAEVAALPMVHRTMTTYDFYESFKGSFASRGETVNCLLVLGGDPHSPGIFHHVQSMLLLRHPGLFVLTARLALAASVLAYILGSHPRHEGWMDQELAAVVSVAGIYTRPALQTWHAYLDDMRSNDDFRRCLVPESPKLPAHCRCPGLTKYLLALYVAIKGTDDAPPRPFSPEELRARHHALVVEFLSRCRIGFFDAFEHAAPTQPREYLQAVWDSASPGAAPHAFAATVGDGILAAALTAKEARARFAEALRLDLSANDARNQDRVIVSTTFAPPLHRIHKLQHYQLTLKRIHTAFARLALLCGHEPTSANFGMDRHTLIRALHTAHFQRTAAERCEAPAIQTPFPKDELRNILGTHFSRQFNGAVLALADEFATARFEEHHAKTHSALARPLPAAHIERFREEFGLDIGADWGVNSSGLSTLACCSPQCSHYLDLLEPPSARTAVQKLDQSEAGRPAEPRICKALRQHLQPSSPSLPNIQGFHKTVAHCQNLSAPCLAVKISLGECLHCPFPTRDDLRSLGEITRSVASGPPPPQDREQWCQWKALETRLAALRQAQEIRRQHDMLQGLQDAINTRCLRDPDFVVDSVHALQKEMRAPTWEYEDFRATFLAKYEKFGTVLCRPLS